MDGSDGVSAAMGDAMRVFDRNAVRRHRDRAAAELDAHAFLLEETGERLLDRLDDVTRRFPLALDLGCHTGQLRRKLGGRGGIRTLVQADLSPLMARRAGGLAVAADEELLPFADECFDLVLSNLSLHWVNDLPGALIQIRRALKPDGLFLASLLGGETLKELRQALMAAETDVEGGVSPRVSPFADVRDMGDLLQRAGFALPVADFDSIAVSYADPFRLMSDLRGMGEANAVAERRKSLTRRRTLLAAADQYKARFAGADGRLTASFQVIFLTAWAPHPEQRQALAPGSAAQSLADALGSQEIPAGDKADPGPRPKIGRSPG